MRDGRYNTKELWRNADGTELHPHTNYYVGGNTKFYGAALFRLRERDFGEIKHYGGISPAWPISYDELEPYYTEAERIYHVHGAVGEDPTEPHRSGAFPYPAISHEPRIQQLSDDFARLGLKPFHTPLGVMLDEKNRQKSPCIRCNTCDGFPCLVNAKADAHICCVVPALKHPNVTLLTDTKVTRLETDGSGREVTAVQVERNGAKESYSGKIRRRVRRRNQFSRVALAFGQRQTSERPGQWFGCCRPALHGARQFRFDGAVEMPEPDCVSENTFG